MGRVVGIDLGTTNSVVAVMEGGKPLVIANSEGMRTTPSVAGFNKDGELVVGQLARRQAVLNPQNTFYGVKRFIGRRYAELETESKRVPYTIRSDETGSIKIRCPRLKKEFAPEEISAMVLRKLAEEASRYLGETVTGAVITVPAYFNDSQRQATRDAGKIAGLEVLRIINEPTAASLAYGLEQRRNQTVLVFDLGGGTFDVSILEIGDGVFEVKATSGDTQLGGNDFDKKIVDWLATEFQEKEGVDLRRDRQALQRLIEAAEKAKIELSGVSVTEINLPFIIATEDGPKHIETQLSRAKFEELCEDLVSRLRRPVKRAFYDANITPAQIDEVILVGGGTRMPMVKELVKSYINIEPNENVNPDEVVGVGAAIQAGILQGEVKDILLLDVTPLSLGIETTGGLMKKLIPRNTTIPVRRSDIFSTSENNQTMVEIQVLQGEREMAAGNKSLGKFRLTGIPPAPRGMPQIQVAFDIDANGILQVTAVDKTTGRQQSVIIQGSSTLTESEVNRMITEASQFAEEDRERKERIEKRNRAKTLADQAQRKLKEIALDYGTQFASYYRRRIDTLCQDILDSLEKGDERRLDRTQADLQDALYELNREIRLQYESEEDEGFFASLRRTLIGDDEQEDNRYYSSRDYYRDDYRSSPRYPTEDRYNNSRGDRDNYEPPNRGYREETPRSGYRNETSNKGYREETPRSGYRNETSNKGYREETPRSGYRNDYESRKSSRNDYPPETNSSYNKKRGRGGNIPYENDWDEEDDEWF